MKRTMTFPSSPAAEVRDDAPRRMLAARDRVRRWFSPEAMADVDAEAPEVIGVRAEQRRAAESAG